MSAFRFFYFDIVLIFTWGAFVVAVVYALVISVVRLMLSLEKTVVRIFVTVLDNVLVVGVVLVDGFMVVVVVAVLVAELVDIVTTGKLLVIYAEDDAIADIGEPASNELDSANKMANSHWSLKKNRNYITSIN
jgi:hypothetical protein